MARKCLSLISALCGQCRSSHHWHQRGAWGCMAVGQLWALLQLSVKKLPCSPPAGLSLLPWRSSGPCFRVHVSTRTSTGTSPPRGDTKGEVRVVDVPAPQGPCYLGDLYASVVFFCLEDLLLPPALMGFSLHLVTTGSGLPPAVGAVT